MNTGRIITTALATSILALPAMAGEQSPGSFQIPGTQTTLKFYGIVQVDATDTLQGGDPDPLAKSPSLDGAYPNNIWKMTARASRFGFMTTTPTEYGPLNVRVEGDFKIQNGTTGSYPFRLRFAYVELGPLLVGQMVSNQKDTFAMPDCVDNDGTIGPYYTGTFNRQVRYAFHPNAQSTFSISLEDDNTPTYTVNGVTSRIDSKFPGGLTAAYRYQGDWGHVFVSGAVQRYSFWQPQKVTPGTSTVTQSHLEFDKTCSTFTVGANVYLAGEGNHKDNLVVAVLKGDAPGPYGTWMPGDGAQVVNNNSFEAPQEIAAHIGYTHYWGNSDKWRSNLIYAFCRLNYDSKLHGPNESTSTSSKQGQQCMVNTWVKLTKASQLGIEYSVLRCTPFGANFGNTVFGVQDHTEQRRVSLCFKSMFFGL